MAENEIIKIMTLTAENILRNESDKILNLLIFHVVIGSHVDDESRPREMNHQFPILAEKIIYNPLDTFSSSIMKHQYLEINIYQHILLIDPSYNNPKYLPIAENLLPPNIIEILDRILPVESERNYTICDNLNSVSHIIEKSPMDNSDNIMQINIHTEFEFIPYHINPKLLKQIEYVYPALTVLFPNVLITYFDMSGQNYDECPLVISQRNTSIYTLLSDCMINYNDIITSPFLDIKDGKLQWFTIPSIDNIDQPHFSIDEKHIIQNFAYRYYEYFYRENLIPIIMQILPYLRDKYAYHIATGEQLELESIELESLNIYLDNYIIPLIKYRFSINENYNLIEWYFRNIQNYHSDRKQLSISLFNFIQKDMEYLNTRV